MILRFWLNAVSVKSIETTCLRKGLEVRVCVAQGQQASLRKHPPGDRFYG